MMSVTYKAKKLCSAFVLSAAAILSSGCATYGGEEFGQQVNNIAGSWADIRKGLILFCGPDDSSSAPASNCPTHVWNIKEKNWNVYDSKAIDAHRDDYDLRNQWSNRNLQLSLQVLVERLFSYDSLRDTHTEDQFLQAYEINSRRNGALWPRLGLSVRPNGYRRDGSPVWWEPWDRLDR